MLKDKTPYRILVVEDNTGDFVLIEDFLEEQILVPKIIRATSYKDAYRILTTNDRPFDVILLDLSLPDLTGESLIESMITFSEGSPVIVLTGYTDINFGLKSLALGASDYLLKDHLTSSTLHKSILYNIERKKAFSRLEQSEKRYSELFHLSPQPMWVYDIETYRFLDVNEAAIKSYLYTREEFLSLTVRDIRPSEDVHLMEEAMRISKKSDQLHFKGDFRHVKKNGEIIHVEITSTSIHFNGVAAKIVLANDVTDRLHYIQAIEKQNEALKQIAWQHSHILRAPLARIMGIVNMIEINKGIGEKDETLRMLSFSANELDDAIKKITLSATASPEFKN